MSKKKVVYTVFLISLILLSISLLTYSVCIVFSTWQKAVSVCPLTDMQEIAGKRSFRIFFLASPSEIPIPYGYRCITVNKNGIFEFYFVEEEREDKEYIPTIPKTYF